MAETIASDQDLEPRALGEDLLLLPVSDPPARAAGLRAQGFALRDGDRLLLVDTVGEHHLPALRRFFGARRGPAALALTHHHVLGFGDAFLAIAEAFGAPVLLHPADVASSRRARGLGARFEDPMASALLAEMGVDVTLCPGHTAGHVLLRYRGRGGLLFAGDCAVGPTVDEARAGRHVALRPPAALSEDDALLQRSWQAFDKPVAGILPFHGEPLLDRADALDLLAPLRGPDPRPDFPR